MKAVIATLIALSATAPTFAQVTSADIFFALGNDSAAERIVSETSTGNVAQAQLKGALANDSAAEAQVNVAADVATKADSGLLSFFALGNDSAAERVAN